jgi:3-deoxy-D-arabino-heptulosonate 7-phosphate (DAHP) synthase
MLEVHPNPSEAWVDPLQALNYDEFAKLAGKIQQIAKMTREN